MRNARRYLGRILVALALLTGTMTAGATSAQADPYSLSYAYELLSRTNDGQVLCLSNVRIYSPARQLNVSSEQQYTRKNYAMLRARTESSEGPWEQFQVCFDNRQNTRYWTLRSQTTGNYVAAEFDYTGTRYAMLRARSTSVGSWERWFLAEDAAGYINILSLHRYETSGGTSGWVSAEFDYSGSTYGMLRARTAGTALGPWEQFL